MLNKTTSCIILVVLALALTNVHAEYKVAITCSSQACVINGKTCNKCLELDGGPFESYVQCADSDSRKLQLCNSFVSFGCVSTCISGISYTTLSPLGLYYGCTTDDDPSWNCPTCSVPGVKQFLDLLYIGYTRGKQTSYDWTSPCAVTINIETIVIIILGALLFIGIVFGIIRFFRRRKAARSKFSQNSSKDLLIDTTRMNV